MPLRFKHMKLSGFKSFVDQTKVLFPSDLVGIIGPNGCGKSNTIDAVRWVMGESSAKQLRGESITDVIFNGSSRRKPVGQASVELVFDNSDATLGGEYASYAEISIRREVTRDGVSNYYLNGTRCRRRDITDVFKGTGLGPRSYAIIEQGTISKLVEAKPDDMRSHFEEVAQISKYKERRHETELRIHHARENLERLEDVRDELQKQLNHLTRQASVAKRYRELKDQERVTRSQLNALQWLKLQETVEKSRTEILEQETALEKENASLSQLNVRYETQREQQVVLTENFQNVQQKFYALGSEIGRIEQDIAHRSERSEQLRQDSAQVETELQDVQTHLESDQKTILDLTTQLETLEPEFETISVEALTSKTAQETADTNMQAWQVQWEAFNKESAKITQEAEVEQTRIQHLEQRILAVTDRLEKLNTAQSELRATIDLEKRLEELNQEINVAENHYQTAVSELTNATTAINDQRQNNQKITLQLDDAKNNYQRLQGRLSSVEALQQAALGKKDRDLSAWLEQQQLQGKSRLAEKMTVQPEWQTAVETVLGSNLQAVCADSTESLASALQQLKHGSLTIIDTSVSSQDSSSRLETLISKVQSSINVEGLLGGIYIASDVSTALTMRPQLSAHESIVTRDGVWLGRNWVRVIKSVDQQSGVLQREQELQELKQQSAKAQVDVSTLQAQLDAGREKIQALELSQKESQNRVTERQSILVDLRAQVKVQQADLQQVLTRKQQIEKELTEFTESLTSTKQQLTGSRQVWQTAMQAMENYSKAREEQLSQREALSVALQAARTAAHADRERQHECQVKLETLRSQRTAINQAFDRLTKQQVQLQERQANLQAQCSENEAPMAALKETLSRQVQDRSGIEKSLEDAKQRLSVVDHELRELEEERGAIDERRQAARESLESLRLNAQESKVRSQALKEQMAESGVDLEVVLTELDRTLVLETVAQELQALEERIGRLGAVNLAAIEELEEVSKRKVYLDEQNADVVQALATLEEAISKIDKETRDRFRETFDTVNTTFKELFPKIFGGGEAYLELTGDDWLTAGITVMARPPGKRNGTIHLLSGGEKALTAIALVFSIFQLSPSPFCMLDEVDAPLDDANVGRFCNLVKEMSKSVQFIVITHNKVTMEMATHLIGVTMNEPGVSRIVSVDMDEAVKMAVA